MRYDTASSAEVQAAVKRIAGQIEAMLVQQAVAMRTGAAGEYGGGAATEYKRCAGEVLGVIQLLLRTMGDDDEPAAERLREARAAVECLGG